MGIPDSNYDSDQCKQERMVDATKLTSSNPNRSPWKSLIINIFIWIILALILLALFDHYKPVPRSHPRSVENILAPKAILNNCGSLPPHGSAYIIDPSVMKRTDVLYSGLEIQNNYNHPMVAIISDSKSTRQLLAVSISSEDAIQISVPVGQYGMQVLVGSKWCNLETGFSDGANISVSGKISVTAGSTTQMQFSGSGLDPIQIALTYNLVTPSEHQKTEPSEIIGNGKLELKQTREGHYYSSGTINGSPIVFMIDTGATIIAISAEMAASAGIKNCSPHFVTTASGKVQGCIATAAKITFGSFALTNIAVSILPDMPGEALLGMNVLRNFHIEQIDDIMRISSR